MEFTTIANAKKQTKLSYLGTVNASAKLGHSAEYSHQHTYAIYLAPANTSGYNVCSHSTPECRLGCLATSGRTAIEIFSGINVIRNSRIKKTRLFYEEPEFFMQWMIAEIKAKKALAHKKGFFFSVRLNATSDIDWQNVLVNGKNIFEIFPDIQFYDYTKNANKFLNIANNYHLTLSYTGRNLHACEVMLKRGYNVAIVFNVKHENDLPKTFMGYNVVNGDLTDARFLDGNGLIVGLKWKRIADRQAETNVLNSVFVVNPLTDNRCNTNVQINELQLV